MKTQIAAIIMSILFALILCSAVSATSALNVTNSSVQIADIQVPFVENQGQQPDEVKYTADTYYGIAYVTNDSITHAVNVNDTNGVALKEQFLKNGSAVSLNPQGENKSTAKVSYLTGSSSYTNLSTYNQIALGEIYSGITVKLKAHGGTIEKLFYVQPGANIGDILIQVLGANSLQVLGDGRLAINTDGGIIYMSAPQAYQDGQNVSVSYKLLGNNTYGFHVGEYDSNKTLIIDPYLIYSTYLGGNSGDVGKGIVVDSQGNVYITGNTQSSDFPTTTGAYQTAYNGGDVFVSKFSPNGTLIYSTYFGGNGNDAANGIAVDSQGNIYVAGNTKSSDFPTTTGAYQTNLNGVQDGFITKFSSDGTKLLYSTYIGGSSTSTSGDAIETIGGIAVDSSGNMYVTGQTDSTDFPTTAGAYQPNLSRQTDAFVVKFDSTGNRVYSTYFGGTFKDTGCAIAVDSQGNAYVTGFTSSSNLATTGAYQTKIKGMPDAFVVKFDPTGNRVYSTYFGGISSEYAYGIAVDSQGNAYITGQTQSSNLATTGAYQTTRALQEAFIAKLSSDGSKLLYSTYLGGSGNEDARAIAVDTQGNVYITGNTQSTNFPLQGAYQTTNNGGDAYVAKLSSDGIKLLFSTYLGGSSNDYGYGIAVDNQSNVYVTGQASVNFPTKGAYKSELVAGDSSDVFVAEFATLPTVNVNLVGGLFNTTQEVVLTTPDSTANIYYTTDGTDPTTSSFEYNGSIIINSTTTLKYAAIDTVGTWGQTYAQTYIIDTTAPVPSADLPGGSYNTTQTVTLSATDDVDNDPKIYYTLDGSTPTTSSKLYDEPISIANTTTLKFIAVDEAGNQSPVQSETYNIKSSVYVNIVPSKTNPQVGDKVTYTFKLGNNGPGIAKGVVFTYVIPEGLEYMGATVDQGTVSYDESTRTLTWNLGDVKVGDPYLWLNVRVLSAGSYNLQPTVSAAGYDPDLEGNIGSLLVNAVSKSAITVSAATTSKTIPIQDTGLPLTGLISALLLVGSGLALARKK